MSHKGKDEDTKVAERHPPATAHSTQPQLPIPEGQPSPDSVILGHRVGDPSKPPAKVDQGLVDKDPVGAQVRGGVVDEHDVVTPFAATPATLWGTEMTQLIGNVSGGGNMPQNLITSLLNGRGYCFVANVPLAAQASGSVIGVARLPVPYNMTGITALASVSLGTSTIAIGSPSDSAQAGYWVPAQTLTVLTPVSLGVNATLGVPVLVGYDALTGQQAGYQPGHQGGGQYDDIILTVGAAALPASGNLRLFFEYQI